MTRRLEGKPVAESLVAEFASRLEKGRDRGWPTPILASVHIGEKTPFSVYLKRQQREAERFGIEVRSVSLADGLTQDGLETTLRNLDGDPAVDGVLLQHPLPEPLDFFRAVGTLSAEKDVDGVSAASLGRLTQERPLQVPAVARAALSICRHYEIPLAGLPVTVVGRSPTVGIPLSLLLLAKGAGADATVTVAHSRTRDLKVALEGASVIFSCAGVPGLLDRSNVPRKTSVIDVGLSTVPDPSRPSGMRAAGDTAADLEGWVDQWTPVPGGVGPVTVAELMANVLRAWEWRRGGGP
ncbi:MAG TPA: bifunctional 5,10-methylenetetrahydrofolate dehydrogenase/5,10-methenyltetrahydrofolate cyclohydrolase [Thermoplasmata archaeon]|nr:bifunctional 5,10-methylenetetrahydrofolate dehydrogenase/5,10-methenyltetrahydrofolate cyclohydrolase [Thermoplasmata archaeon]